MFLEHTPIVPIEVQTTALCNLNETYLHVESTGGQACSSLTSLGSVPSTLHTVQLGPGGLFYLRDSGHKGILTIELP